MLHFTCASISAVSYFFQFYEMLEYIVSLFSIVAVLSIPLLVLWQMQSWLIIYLDRVPFDQQSIDLQKFVVWLEMEWVVAGSLVATNIFYLLIRSFFRNKNLFHVKTHFEQKKTNT